MPTPETQPKQTVPQATLNPSDKIFAKEGAKDNAESLQKVLAGIGFYQGKITGVFDQETVEAVEKLFAVHGREIVRDKNGQVVITADDWKWMSGIQELSDTFIPGLHVTFGSYAGKPIEWTVLAEDNGYLLLISRYGIDVRQYNDSLTSVKWANSSLYEWLNGEFYDQAFMETEKEKIRLIKKDKVILFNQLEVARYFVSDEQRKCAPSELALANGAFTENGFGWWWLQSPGKEKNSAVVIASDGSINTGGSLVTLRDIMVRPVIWASKKSVVRSDVFPITAICTANSVNLRESDKVSSQSLALLKKGDKVSILEIGDEWSLVEFDEKKGYVKTKYLEAL
jgi:uncharacterized protein YgiM (DUF1202 family)